MSDTTLDPSTVLSSTRESISPTSAAMVLNSHVAPSAGISYPHVSLSSPQLSTVSESRLLRLPPELRYMIYNYTLALMDCPFGFKDSFSQLSFDGHVHTSILLVCRQIYEEARSICFQISALPFPAGHAFDVFLEKLASWQRDEVKSITLRLPGLAYDHQSRMVFKGWKSLRISRDMEIISNEMIPVYHLGTKILRLKNLKHIVFEWDTPGFTPPLYQGGFEHLMWWLDERWVPAPSLQGLAFRKARPDTQEMGRFYEGERRN